MVPEEREGGIRDPGERASMAPLGYHTRTDRVGHQGGDGGLMAQIGDGAENYDVNREQPPCGGEKRSEASKYRQRLQKK